MDESQERGGSLPVRRNLTPAFASSVGIAILMAAASVAGLGYRSAVYPTEELARTFVSNDVVCLLVGLPLLLGSVALAWRGRLTGLLMWPGALLFVLYNYIAYVLAVPPSAVYPLYLALVVSSACTLVALVAAIDGKSVQRVLEGRVAGRITACILAGLGMLFFLRSLGILAGAVTGGATIAATDLAVNLSDLLVSPVWVLGGILLWRRKPLGYVLGLGLLLGLSLLFLALVIYMLLQPILTAAPFALLDVVVVLLLGLVSYVPGFAFARKVASNRGTFTA